MAGFSNFASIELRRCRLDDLMLNYVTVLNRNYLLKRLDDQYKLFTRRF